MTASAKRNFRLNWFYYLLSLLMLGVGVWLFYFLTNLLLSWFWILVVLVAPIMAVVMLVLGVLLLRVIK